MGDVNDILQSIYYNSKHPASYGGVRTLYNAAREQLPRIKYKQVVDWLSGENAYTLHKPARRQWVRNKIYVSRIDEQWQADLVEMQDYSSANSGVRYLLTIIDCFSKYAWVQPLKDKTASSVRDAFRLVIGDRKPEKIQTDHGKEFIAKVVQIFFNQNNIVHFTSNNTTIKCAMIERFNRTLKSRMFRYFTAHGTQRYFDKLQDFVSAYKRSYHRSIKMKPIDVTYSNQTSVLKNLYGVSKLQDVLLKSTAKPKLVSGDSVRKKYQLKPFDKSYFPTWEDQVFKVKKTVKRNIKPIYSIEDVRGNVQRIRYYPEELQKVKVSTFRIEKVLRRRTRNGKREVFVKWLGYPDSFNEWLPASAVKDIK